MESYTVLPNRLVAGERLAGQLLPYQHHPQGLILALPRGGVPVAFALAQQLQLPLDLCLVRKIGSPNQPELALGAIAQDNIQIFNQALIEQLQLPWEKITPIIERERQELDRRNHTYRGQKPYPNLQDRIVILVDDGLATGATMMAAIAFVRSHHPQRIILTIPVVAPSALPTLRGLADEIITLITPESLHSISLWYDDFRQVTDQEVHHYLKQAGF